MENEKKKPDDLNENKKTTQDSCEEPEYRIEEGDLIFSDNKGGGCFPCP